MCCGLERPGRTVAAGGRTRSPPQDNLHTSVRRTYMVNITARVPPPPTPALKPPFPPTPCRLSLPPFFSPPHPRNIIQRLSGQRASRRSPWKTLWVRLPPGVAPRSPMRSRQSYCSASESSSKNKEKDNPPPKTHSPHQLAHSRDSESDFVFAGGRWAEAEIEAVRGSWEMWVDLWDCWPGDR